MGFEPETRYFETNIDQTLPKRLRLDCFFKHQDVNGFCISNNWLTYHYVTWCMNGSLVFWLRKLATLFNIVPVLEESKFESWIVYPVFGKFYIYWITSLDNSKIKDSKLISVGSISNYRHFMVAYFCHFSFYVDIINKYVDIKRKKSRIISLLPTYDLIFRFKVDIIKNVDIIITALLSRQIN